MTVRTSAVFVFVALSASLLVAGCSDSNKSFSLKGTVSYQGKPLPSGVVRLHMAGHPPAMAIIQANGSFEATDVFPGEAKVTVEEDPAEKQRRAMSGGAAAPKAAAPSVAIPPKYQDAKTSDLTFTLKAGKPLNIELK